MILLVDNYDSFTWNLVQAMEMLGGEVLVKQNDQIDFQDVSDLKPDHIVISPGPGRPANSGNANQIIKALLDKNPILGVCLGHQCIGSILGVDVVQSKRILHGKTSLIHHDQTGLFEQVPSPFQAARYHSLSLEAVPDHFEKTAWTNDGEIMAITHKRLPVFGVQFHPESFLTPMGSKILENFLNV
ncbi:aminodeoxychorismate/anthranilate synthase component II [Caldithrix abyssi]|nr:aminodeoxychorismate/anthranilate synthase component II [Caldithrix abyssi]